VITGVEMNTDVLNLTLCSIPFWLPAGLGLYLWLNRPHALGRMAALLTLKPILATPLWLAILSAEPQPSPLRAGLSALPGLTLTLLIVWACRSVFSGSTAGPAWSLLGLDGLRWLNSAALALTVSGRYSQATGSLACLMAQIGLALPSLFALAALAVSVPQGEAPPERPKADPT